MYPHTLYLKWKVMTSSFILDRFYDSTPNRESVMEFCTSYYHCHYSTIIGRRKVQNLNYLPSAFTWAVEEYSFLKDSFCLNGSDSVCCFSASNNSHLFLPLSELQVFQIAAKYAYGSHIFGLTNFPEFSPTFQYFLSIFQYFFQCFI